MRDSGFTLIETLLALLVSAVALGASLHLLVVSVVAARSARDESVATWLAHARYERLRHDRRVPSGRERVTTSGEPDAERGAFRRTWSATQHGGVRVIDVEVRSSNGRVLVHLRGAMWITP